MAQLRRDFLKSLSCAVPTWANSAPASIDVGRQLFVDNDLVESSTLKVAFHKPRVHEASPVLKPETDWELNNGVMPTAAPFSDGVWYDPKDRLYKIWYIGGYDDGICHATSQDGFRWKRPNLDVVPGTNRVLAPVRNYVRNGNTIWLDHDAQDPNERYKMFIYYRRGTGSWPRKNPAEPLAKDAPSFYGNVLTSPDGIHWSKPVMTGSCGDNSSLFYNPFRKMWVFSIRKNRAGFGRARSYRETPDPVKGAAWKNEDVHDWLTCDANDKPDPVLKMRPELYKVDCVAYESRMLGLFGIYYGPSNDDAYREKIPKTNDLHVGFSRDGRTWNRPDRTAFLACSRKAGTWDRGYLHAAGGCCLIVGDELRFHYTGFSGVSPAQGGGPYAGATTGVATLRRDGFVSLAGPGELTTRAVTFKGKYIFVNANMQGGEMRIEVFDEQNNVIKPFSKANCIALGADKPKQAVTWKGASDLARLAGRPVKFRFHLSGGELYSYWVSPERSGASHGYVAAGGPGFTGPTDTTGA